MIPIRVAFSGSGFKAPAHVGALFAIRDAGFAPKQSLGTSGGALVSGLNACGMSLDDMKTLCMSKDWSKMMCWSPRALFNGGFCDGKNLLGFLEENTGAAKFHDVPIEFGAVASNLTNNVREIFDYAKNPFMSVALAIRASASIPFVYEPVIYGGKIYQDGGMCSNIAVDSLTVDNVPRLGVQLVSQETPLKPTRRLNPVALGLRIIDLMMSACESAHVTAAQESGAHMAFVETGYASTLARNAPLEIRQRLFADGYASTKAALADLVTAGSVLAT